MRLVVARKDAGRGSELHVPADINWEMLDKSRFFFLGAALFSAVSGALYPTVVLKTRQQVQAAQQSCIKMAFSIIRYEGLRGLYKGFGTSLMGTIPARAVYMTALEVTKSRIGSAAYELDCSDATAVAIANAAGGLSSAMAAQLVWTPIDVVSQRLMVQGSKSSPFIPNVRACKYNGGVDAFRKILYADGLKGLYRGFGVSILTYAPSNAVWWASYSMAYRVIWESIGCNDGEKQDFCRTRATVVGVQGVSAAMASGISALITMPLDTIKTRMQVLEDGEKPTIGQTVRNLVKEGGLRACYRGLGPRWISMSMSAATMITTYEYLKKLSTKSLDSFTC